MILAEDLETPAPDANQCMLCGLEVWSCICDPARPYRKPTAEEVEAARRARLTKAELEREAGK